MFFPCRSLHCDHGIGRSGAFLLMDNLYHELEDNEEICQDWQVSALPTLIFVHLEDEEVVKDYKIEGYDWMQLIMTYNKIIEKDSL